VLETVATAGTGVADLVEVIDRALPAAPERRAARRHRQAHAQLLAIAGELARLRLLELSGTPEAPGLLARLVDDVAERRRDPHTAAQELVAALLR